MSRDAKVQRRSRTGGGKGRGDAFSGLAGDGLASLLAIGDRRRFESGEVLLHQGAETDRFFVVARGRLKASFNTRAGRAMILGLYGPGEIVGLPSALAGTSSRTAVAAAAETDCLVVPRQRLLELLSGRPELIAELLPRLVRNLTGCSNCLVEVMACAVEVRLACLFLRLLAEDGSKPETGWVPVPLSRSELAELTGTTVESCSRVMAGWRRRGIVTTADGGFRVHDPGALREIALG